ncbi:MAG: T9SS type A sorting domain-containing protein [Candidatus Zhuqueibacterota bacterium]
MFRPFYLLTRILLCNIIIIIILILFNFTMVFAQRLVQGEIILSAVGINENENWYADFTALSSELRWWNDYKITTSYGSGYAGSVTGPYELSPAIDAPNSYDFSGPVVAYGIYDFTFHFPFGDKDFTLDLRDANWCYQGMADIYIRWNNSLSVQNFEYKNSLTEPDWETLGSSGSSHSIWDLFSQTPPNQAAFQPTKPENFICYNAGQIGQHPYFVWSQSDGCGSTTIYYKMFRSENSGAYACIQEGITGNSWTDYEVCIGTKKQGSFFSYYLKGYTGQSPESASSDIASIWANQISKPVGEEPYLLSTNAYHQTSSEVNFFNLALSPNPFNSTTNIHYAIPDDGHVRLVVYNIYGQRVVSCVDRSQNAGPYQYHFDGTNLAGGFYLVWLQFNNQRLCRKILLLK